MVLLVVMYGAFYYLAGMGGFYGLKGAGVGRAASASGLVRAASVPRVGVCSLCYGSRGMPSIAVFFRAGLDLGCNKQKVAAGASSAVSVAAHSRQER